MHKIKPLRQIRLFGLLLCLAVLFAGAMEVQAKKCSSFDEFSSAVGKMVKSNTPKTSQASFGEWDSGRLIVQAKGKFDPSKYSPSSVIEGPGRLFVLQFASPSKAKSAYRKIVSDGKVIYAEPDSWCFSSGTTVSSGVSTLSYGSKVTGLADYAAKLSVPSSRKVTVAVVDSGVSAHSMFGSRLLKGYDFVEMDTDATDKTGHGTHVAGIIVDSTPSLNVRILPVRVLNTNGTGMNSVVGLGVRYAAEKGAKVINLSLSGDHSAFVESCIEYAVSKGCVVCVASGNNGRRMKKTNDCPGHLSAKGVITVGSLSKTLSRSTFSNYGAALDIMAPGEGIKSAYLKGNYKTMNGTSMATPYVSAAAAIYRLRYPSDTASGIKKRVLKSTVDKGKSGRDDYYGRGMLKMPGS